MKLFIYLFVPTFLFLQGSCKKDPLVIQPVVEQTTPTAEPIEVVWRSPLEKDTFNQIASFKPAKFGNVIVFSSELRENHPAYLHGHDITTGSRIWEWHDYQRPVDSYSMVKPYGEKLIVCDWAYIYVIQGTTGQTIWYNKNEGGGPKFNLIGNEIYHTKNWGGTENDSATLVRSTVETNNFSKVLTIAKKNGYCPAIESTALWINPSNDSILVFQNRSFNFDSLKGKIDLLGYNLKLKKYEFVFENIDPSGNSCAYQIKIKDNLAFFMGQNHLFAIDLINKSIKWQKTFKGTFESFVGDDILIAENSLIAKPGGYSLYAFEQKTGNEIWTNTNVRGGDYVNLTLFNNKIIMLRSKLYAFDFSNGKLLWEKKSPNQYSPNRYYGEFGEGDAFTIDPTTNYIYTNDDRWAMCLKMSTK